MIQAISAFIVHFILVNAISAPLQIIHALILSWGTSIKAFHFPYPVNTKVSPHRLGYEIRAIKIRNSVQCFTNKTHALTTVLCPRILLHLGCFVFLYFMTETRIYCTQSTGGLSVRLFCFFIIHSQKPPSLSYSLRFSLLHLTCPQYPSIFCPQRTHRTFSERSAQVWD